MIEIKKHLIIKRIVDKLKIEKHREANFINNIGPSPFLALTKAFQYTLHASYR